jgi:hypothetical protein
MSESRIEATRRRLKVVRTWAAVGSAVLFGGAFLAARASHAASSPGTSTQTADTTAEGEDDPTRSFDFGDSSLGSSGGAAPSVASGSS